MLRGRLGMPEQGLRSRKADPDRKKPVFRNRKDWY